MIFVVGGGRDQCGKQISGIIAQPGMVVQQSLRVEADDHQMFKGQSLSKSFRVVLERVCASTFFTIKAQGTE